MTASTRERGKSVPPSEAAVSTHSTDQGAIVGRRSAISRAELQGFPRIPSLSRHPRQASAWLVNAGMEVVFVVALFAYTAAYVWLALPTFFFTMLDDLTSSWQIVGFVVGSVTLTATLMWLPLLLAPVAKEGRWGAILELATVRKLAGQTPFCWAIATAVLFACSIVPLLYTSFFKNRIPAHDAVGDLMLVFFVTVVPARVLMGWVYHRATQRNRSASSRRWRIWQWTNGAALCAGVGGYVYFLYLAETGGELGERAVRQFHALLLPFPF